MAKARSAAFGVRLHIKGVSLPANDQGFSLYIGTIGTTDNPCCILPTKPMEDHIPGIVAMIFVVALVKPIAR